MRPRPDCFGPVRRLDQLHRAGGRGTFELSDADRAAIEAINAGQVAAWNRGDAEGYAARALPGLVFTNILGARYVGRDAAIALWNSIFAGIYKGVPIQQRIEGIVLVHPDVAIVEILNRLPGDIPELARGFPIVNGGYLSRMQQVMVRKADGWWLASGHNVPVLPPAANTLPAD